MIEKRKTTPSKRQETKTKKAKDRSLENAKETKGLKNSMKKMPGRVVASAQKKQKENEVIQSVKTSQREPAANDFPRPDNDEEDPKNIYFKALGARIAQRAYELYEARGGAHGHDFEDWLEAERQIMSEKITG